MQRYNNLIYNYLSVVIKVFFIAICYHFIATKQRKLYFFCVKHEYFSEK